MIITYNWADENKEVNFYQQAHINKITLMFGSIDMVYNARNQTYRIVLFFIWIMISGIYITACTPIFPQNNFHISKLGNKNQGQEVSYEICEEKNMPHRLQKIIEDRKNRPGTFAYKNSKYTYLVVCYGEKPYSGYSIRIEECWKDKEQLYLKTQLIGPSAGEEIIETRTCPFLVVRCERTERLCRIES